jgi:hypothetical protein
MVDALFGWASLIIVAASVRLWFGRIKRVEIPKNRSGFVAAWAVSAALGVTALAGEPGWIGVIPATCGVIASCFFLLTVAIGDQKVADGAIRVGATIPEFAATDEHGQTFDSASLAGHLALIKFFRGHW